MLVLLLAVAAIYFYFREPTHRRAFQQRVAETRESLAREKKLPVWEGTVVVVEALEGDKLQVNTENSPNVVVRLAGVDAPELPDRFKRGGQPLAEESRDYLSSLVANKAVQMSIMATDVSKTPLVLIHAEGEFINYKIVASGLAEASGEGLNALPAALRHALENAEYIARAGHLKIWSLSNYVRPVEYRIRQQRALGLPTPVAPSPLPGAR